MRVAWRVLVAGKLDARELVFVDEMGTHTSLAPLYGYSPRGERVYLEVPRNRGKNTTLIASMSTGGTGECLAVEGAITKILFEAYVEQVLTPSLRIGQVVVMDNLSAHKSEKIRELIEARGCKLIYLPPYSPDHQPLTWLQYEYAVDGDSLLIGFGPDAGQLDTKDLAAVQKAIRAWLPEAEVVESIGHDWVSDEFSRQTWPMLKPNQLTRYLRELQRPEDCVFLAGSDYANGWMGFIDGAIESGLKVSREVNEHLSAQA